MDERNKGGRRDNEEALTVMMKKEALTTCLRSSSLLQAATSERGTIGLLRQLPLPSMSNEGLQSAPHHHNTFTVSGFVSDVPLARLS
jgi:hypothetical protein